MIENEIAVKKLEILVNSNRNLLKTVNIFKNLTYAHYSKQVRLAAR